MPLNHIQIPLHLQTTTAEEEERNVGKEEKVSRRENASAEIISVFAFASEKGKERASVVGRGRTSSLVFSPQENILREIEEQFACLTCEAWGLLVASCHDEGEKALQTQLLKNRFFMLITASRDVEVYIAIRKLCESYRTSFDILWEFPTCYRLPAVH